MYYINAELLGEKKELQWFEQVSICVWSFAGVEGGCPCKFRWVWLERVRRLSIILVELSAPFKVFWILWMSSAQPVFYSALVTWLIKWGYLLIHSAMLRSKDLVSSSEGICCVPLEGERKWEVDKWGKNWVRKKIAVTFEGKWKLTPWRFFILCPGLPLVFFHCVRYFFFSFWVFLRAQLLRFTRILCSGWKICVNRVLAVSGGKCPCAQPCKLTRAITRWDDQVTHQTLIVER